MNPTLFFVLKFVAASAILTGLYFLVWRHRAPWSGCRRFLLGVVPLSVIFASVTLVTVTTEKFVPFPTTSVEATTQMSESVAETVIPITDNSKITIDPGRMADIRWGQVLFLLWLLGALAIATVSLRQMTMLSRVRRRAQMREVEGVEVYFSGEVGNAFSVGRRVYVDSAISEHQLAIVVRHEREHIARRHYSDLAFLEVLTILFWFDPFVWVVRHECRTVHEFEADRGALDGGIPLKDYMTAILEQTAGVVPLVANGLGSSLIKKRFTTMKKPYQIRSRVIRPLVTASMLAVCFVCFAFIPRYEGVFTYTNPIPPDTEISEGRQFGQAFSRPFTTEDFPADDYAHYGLKIADDGKTLLGVDGFPIAETEVQQFREWDAKILDTRQMQFTKRQRRNSNPRNPMRIVSIERGNNETRITRAMPVYSNFYFLCWNEGTCIIDQKTGDRYMLRSIEAGGMELNRMSYIRGYMGRSAIVTLVFPPLNKNVKVVDFFDPEGFDNVPLEWSSGEARYEGIIVDDYAVNPASRVIK